MKKIIAMALAAVMVLGMSTMTMASEPTDPPAASTTGSITVKNATKGYAYNAYQILDATYATIADDPATTDVDESKTLVSYTTKTPDLFKAEGSPWTVGTIADANGNYTVQLATGKTADDVNTWIKNNLSNFTALTPDVGVDANKLAEAAEVKWTDIPFGYYYITSGLGANVTVDSNTPDVEVYDKNETEPEDPEKTIIEVDGVKAEKITKANAHVGSVVKFQIDARTNNWIDKDTIRTEWEVTDTPTNMTIDLNSVVVKVNGTTLTKDTNYTASLTSGTLKVNIPLTDSNGNSIYAANTLDENNTVLGLIPIEITYTATIDATADSASATNRLPGDNPPPPVVINTYAFQVAKTDGKDPLPGAQFELWSTKGTETDAKLTFIDNNNGTYTYSPTGTVTTLDMTTNTTIVIKGLDTAWTYTLKEITVPKGYNQAADITVEGSKLTEVATTVVNADGTTTTTEIDTTPASTVLFKETVINNAGSELPSTGGIGTTIFYVAGAILVLGGAILLVSRRKAA